MSADAENAAWIASILEAGSDLSPRLIYADWLEEQGQVERAEFIRLACQLTTLAATDPRRATIAQRLNALESAHERQWLKPLRQIGGTWRFLWGEAFVEEAVLRAADLIQHAELIYRHTPLTRVHLREARGHVAALGRIPPLRWLTHLQLTGVEIFDPSPAAGQPSSRFVEGIGDAGASELAQLTHFSRLLHLGLAHNQIGKPGLQALAQWPAFAALQSLDLSHNELDDEAASILAAVPFSRLQTLHIQGNRLTHQGWLALVGSPALARLQCLRTGPITNLSTRFALRVRFRGGLQD